MSLTVSHNIVAKLQLETISLMPLLGGYELVFVIAGDTTPLPSNHNWAVISGARVDVRPAQGPQIILGTSRPDAPVHVRQYINASHVRAEMRLALQPAQLAKIEDLRTAEDLAFHLVLAGYGGSDGSPQRYPVADDFHKLIGRSDWIRLLREANAMDILLLEIPTPLPRRKDEHNEVTEHLQQAQQMFCEGHYTQVVLQCRKTIEALGKAEGRSRFWASESLARLAKDREAMTMDEREIAVQAGLHHFANPAAHAASTQFTRRDAKFALALCAILVARAYEP